MWLLAGSAAAFAGVTWLGVFRDAPELRVPPPSVEAAGFFRRDDGVFVDADGNVVDSETQQRLGLACSELRV